MCYLCFGILCSGGCLLKVNRLCGLAMCKIQISLQELTGKLPKEIPLAPGEPMPQVRKRVRTGFTLSPQIINHASNVSIHHHCQSLLLHKVQYIKNTVWSGPVRSGPVRSGPVRSGPVRSGPVRSGPVRSGPVRSGPVRSGPVRFQIHCKCPVYIMQLLE